MGWSGGSQLLREVWATVRPFVPDEKRETILADLMTVFAREDCGTLGELTEDWPESESAYLAFKERR
jgi:hypothetical protein